MLEVDSPPSLEEDPLLGKFYSALSHSVRREILRWIGGYEVISFSEIINFLKIKPGSFYYHLGKMEGLVTQDELKRFKLTSDGKMAFELLSKTEGHISYHRNNTEEGFSKIKVQGFSWSPLHGYFRNLAVTPGTGLVVSLIVFSQVVLAELSELGVLPFFFDGIIYSHNILITCFQVIISVLIVFLVIEGAQRILERSKPRVTFSPELLLSIPVCFLPLYIYPFLIFVSESLAVPTPVSDPILALITLLVFQVISGVLLVDVIMITKAQSFEKALIPVFFCFYIASIATLGFSISFSL